MKTLERLALLIQLAIRARRAKATPGSTRIIGLTGKVLTEIAPEGTIFLRNELWFARSQVRIAPGKIARVIGVNGVMLDVDPDEDRAPAEKAIRSRTGNV